MIYRILGTRVVNYPIADGRRDMPSVLARRLLGAWSAASRTVPIHSHASQQRRVRGGNQTPPFRRARIVSGPFFLALSPAATGRCCGSRGALPLHCRCLARASGDAALPAGAERPGVDRPDTAAWHGNARSCCLRACAAARPDAAYSRHPCCVIRTTAAATALHADCSSTEVRAPAPVPTHACSG